MRRLAQRSAARRSAARGPPLLPSGHRSLRPPVGSRLGFWPPPTRPYDGDPGHGRERRPGGDGGLRSASSGALSSRATPPTASRGATASPCTSGRSPQVLAVTAIVSAEAPAGCRLRLQYPSDDNSCETGPAGRPPGGVARGDRAPAPGGTAPAVPRTHSGLGWGRSAAAPWLPDCVGGRRSPTRSSGCTGPCGGCAWSTSSIRSSMSCGSSRSIRWSSFAWCSRSRPSAPLRSGDVELSWGGPRRLRELRLHLLPDRHHLLSRPLDRPDRLRVRLRRLLL
jgi:hypothetical protein